MRLVSFSFCVVCYVFLICFPNGQYVLSLTYLSSKQPLLKQQNRFAHIRTLLGGGVKSHVSSGKTFSSIMHWTGIATDVRPTRTCLIQFAVKRRNQMRRFFNAANSLSLGKETAVIICIETKHRAQGIRNLLRYIWFSNQPKFKTTHFEFVSPKRNSQINKSHRVRCSNFETQIAITNKILSGFESKKTTDVQR